MEQGFWKTLDLQQQVQEVSVVQNLTEYLEFVRHIAGEPDWVYANLGHSNVGNSEDVMRTLEYFEAY